MYGKSGRRVPSADLGIDRVAQITHVPVQSGQFLRCLGRGSEQGVAETACLVLQCPSFLGQRNQHLALVAQVSGPTQQAGYLEALQQRRERTGFQSQGVGDGAHSLLIRAPQHVEHEILWVRQAQLIEEGLVGTLDGNASRINGVAQLVVQRGRVVRAFGHCELLETPYSPCEREIKYRDKNYLDA